MVTTRSILAGTALVVSAFTALMLAIPHTRGASHVSSPPTAVAPGAHLPAVSAVAVVRVLPSAVTVAAGGRDVTYPLCSALGGASLEAGYFVRFTVDRGCAADVQVAAAPVCTASGPGSYTSGIWVGANSTAHSVLYRSPGGTRPTLAVRWCQAPAVLSAGGGALGPVTQIKPGAQVRMLMSAGGWVTSVIVQRGG